MFWRWHDRQGEGKGPFPSTEPKGKASGPQGRPTEKPPSPAMACCAMTPRGGTTWERRLVAQGLETCVLGSVFSACMALVTLISFGLPHTQPQSNHSLCSNEARVLLHGAVPFSPPLSDRRAHFFPLPPFDESRSGSAYRRHRRRRRMQQSTCMLTACG